VVIDMGLDQYAYVAKKAGTDHDDQSRRQLRYWRKHPNLQGWMERLWLEKLNVPKVASDQFLEDKYPPMDFNGVELELTWEDVDRLEKDIVSGKVAKLGTQGFFFGSPSDDHYREHDLQFCRTAKSELFLGIKVFYNSSW
jgi:hypothetical protein